MNDEIAAIAASTVAGGLTELAVLQLWTRGATIFQWKTIALHLYRTFAPYLVIGDSILFFT